MRIIVFCLPGLGDALLFTPALRLLRQEHPSADITILTMFPAVADALRTNPDVTTVAYFPFLTSGRFAGLRELRRLRRQRFDISLTAFPAFRREYNLVSFFVGAKRRLAHRFDRGFLTELTFLNTDTIKADPNLHNAENSANLLALLGISVDLPAIRAIPLSLRLTQEDEAAGGRFLASRSIGGRPLVGFHPGTIHYRSAERRRWPTERFAELASQLHREFGTHSLVFEGPSEAGVGAVFEKRLPEATTVVANAPIRTVAALIRRCRLFVSNDSGLMHVAAAMATPVVAIFGQTDPRWVYPWHTRHTIVRADPEKPPSYSYTMRSFPPMPALQQLTTEAVYEQAKSIIHDTLTTNSSAYAP